MLLSGPSMSGKSCLVKKMLESDIIDPKPEKVLWCYSEWQPLYDEMSEAGLVDEFIKGLNYEDYIDGKTPTLLVIDDLQDEVSCDEAVAELFKRGCHHRNLGVIFIVQNLFFQGKKCRDIAVNTQYVIVFRNPSDKMQMNRFAQRCYPGKVPSIMKLYEEEICSQPHRYLLFDFTQNVNENARIRTGITKGETSQCFVID